MVVPVFVARGVGTPLAASIALRLTSSKLNPPALEPPSCCCCVMAAAASCAAGLRGTHAPALLQRRASVCCAAVLLRHCGCCWLAHNTGQEVSGDAAAHDHRAHSRRKQDEGRATRRGQIS
jgi:hypothetical protein